MFESVKEAYEKLIVAETTPADFLGHGSDEVKMDLVIPRSMDDIIVINQFCTICNNIMNNKNDSPFNKDHWWFDDYHIDEPIFLEFDYDQPEYIVNYLTLYKIKK